MSKGALILDEAGGLCEALTVTKGLDFLVLYVYSLGAWSF